MNGKRMREIRERLGLSQVEFAPTIGIFSVGGQVKVSEMENGKRVIPWKTAQLLRCYDVMGLNVVRMLMAENPR